jgi:hypothetical protein
MIDIQYYGTFFNYVNNKDIRTFSYFALIRILKIIKTR